jgi:peptidoglycan/LPS O-acetylase OafA/YrhL
MSSPPANGYRPDIDGLRAISILGVLLFHARVPGFGGGFVGVDVFFVISGFLITQLLRARPERPLRQLLADFYLRRARRILPALFVMLGVTTLVALTLLLPFDLSRFGKYLCLSTLMLGNVAGLTEGAYFVSNRFTAPLLHLWSIGIEEQFYLVYPLVLAALAAWLPRAFQRVLLAIAVLSFCSSVWMSVHWPAINFFVPTSRAWELLAGGAVATYRLPTLRARARGALAFVALLVLAASMVLFDSELPHPGVAALLPCGATAVLLSMREADTLAARALSSSPLVFIGQISYSLYLWHVPALEFLRYYNIRPISPAQAGGALLVSGVLATLSWKFVEQPLRRRTAIRSNYAFVWVAVSLTIALAFGGFALWHSSGLPQRLSVEAQRLVTGAELHPDAARCATLTTDDIARGALCHFGTVGRAPRVLVWGDSHALALMPAYEKLARQRNLRIDFAARAGCRPLSGVWSHGIDVRMVDHCEAFNSSMFAAVAVTHPDIVILNSYWSYPSLDLGPTPYSQAPRPADGFSRGLRETLRRIAAPHRTVCIVRDVPDFPFDIPRSLVMARRRGMDTGFIGMTRADADRQAMAVDTQLLAMQARGEVLLANPRAQLCATPECMVEHDGRALMRDTNHLTVAGSLFVADSLYACVDGARPSLP